MGIFVMVSVVIDTAGPSCGIFIGVVTSKGEVMVVEGVCDVTVAVLDGIGAIVMFLRPTFFNIVAAFDPMFRSGKSFFSSVDIFCNTVPPLPSIEDVCTSVMTVVSSGKDMFRFFVSLFSCNRCCLSRLIRHILL